MEEVGRSLQPSFQSFPCTRASFTVKSGGLKELQGDFCFWGKNPRVDIDIPTLGQLCDSSHNQSSERNYLNSPAQKSPLLRQAGNTLGKPTAECKTVIFAKLQAEMCFTGKMCTGEREVCNANHGGTGGCVRDGNGQALLNQFMLQIGRAVSINTGS